MNRFCRIVLTWLSAAFCATGALAQTTPHYLIVNNNHPEGNFATFFTLAKDGTRRVQENFDRRERYRTPVLFARAERELQQALGDDPESARAHSALAAVYFLEGRKDLVPMEAEKALTSNPNELDAMNWLCDYYVRSGEYAKARSEADRVLERDPLFFPARVNLAFSLEASGHPSDATAVLNFVDWREQLHADQDGESGSRVFSLASTVCRQDTMNLLRDLSEVRVEFLRVLAKQGRRADLDHRTASGVRRAVVQVAPLTGCKVKAAGSIDENPV